MNRLLDGPGLVANLNDFRYRLFRMETLPAYAVTSDGDDYYRWAAGAREPTWERKQPWLDTLRADRAAGRDRCRVRVLSEDLTDYERYACEFGYVYNAEAGEDIRVLRRGEHPIPLELVERDLTDLLERDFWVVDDTSAVLMRYDQAGAFDHAETLRIGVGVYRDARDTAWAAAEPFTQWWARHPELHRPVAA